MTKYRVKREPVVQPQNQSIKLIALTKGQIAIIDSCEYERAMKLNWFAAYRKSVHGFYAAAWAILPDGKRKQIFMHHFVAGNNTEHVDHEDGNGLNNRRKNLRPCSHSQNLENRDKPRHNTSGFKGVSWSKQKGDWEAYITLRRRKINLGHYDVLEEAAQAYNTKALELFGEFARLNHFPLPTSYVN